MAHKTSIAPADPTVNGQVEHPGDAAEPERVTQSDLSFDPADFTRADPPSAGPDPFDPEALRLPQDFHAGLSVRKALVTVPVRKPDKSWFVRAHPDEAYRLQTCVVELKEDRESYLVARHLWADLAAEVTFRPRLLVTAINRQAVVFLWELNLPRPDGRLDEWTRSALEGVQRASKGWVRLAANLSLGAYDVFEAAGSLNDPEWPTVPFAELLKVAFRDKYIDDLDHPVLRKLRGEV